MDALSYHRNNHGKLAITSKVPLETQEDLSLAYSPGVADPCTAISKDPSLSYEYTSRGNIVAVISDGTAVLGLGDIGPEAAMPVMEGKALLFKKFADIDSIPIVLNTQDTDEIVETIQRIAPSFGGINLEDISAPRCFEIERRLRETLLIPVFHDDQHGTAIVTLAGLLNACKVTGHTLEHSRVVISGAGAAGVAVVNILLKSGVEDVILTDSQGIIYEGREGLNPIKEELSQITNRDNISGSLEDALKDAHVFIGLSQPDVLTPEMIQSMASDPIIFALANPIPEIMPKDALAAGASIVATGRSDLPNQINNLLAFPGIFRGALDARCPQITERMKLAAAHAIADFIESPTPDRIVPGPFEEGISAAVAAAVRSALD